MKKYFISLFAIFFLFSCNTSIHYLKKKQYDLAVKHAVKKLIKKPTIEKEILVLEDAYPLANQQNIEEISQLHTEGQPDRWADIVDLYTALKDRQTIVEKVTPLYVDGRTVDFTHVDYDQLIIDAKTKAATYYYTHAKKLMSDDYKEGYRQAYAEFNNVKDYTSAYSDIDSLLIVCKEKGTIHALLIAVNGTIYKLSDEFMINMIDHQTSAISSEWVKYHSTKDDGMTFDFNVNVNLKILEVSGENVAQNARVETKEIQDGYNYVYDSNGNVMKDSTGNDIKTPRYVTISCEIKETRQLKTSSARGEVEYIDNSTNESLIIREFAVDHIFDNYYATAIGNHDALSKESRARLGNKPLPFPTDEEMFYNLSITMKDVISKLLDDNSTNLLMEY